MKRLSIGLLSLAAGCGGAASAPAPPVAVGGAEGPVASAVAPAAARRGAPEALVRAWPFKAPPRFVVHADAGGLLSAKVASGVMQAVLALAGDEMEPTARRCLGDVAGAVREVVVGGGGDVPGGVVIARFEPSAAASLPPCVEALGKAKRDDVPGVPHAWSFGKDDEVLVLTKDGLFVGGTRELVDRALSGRGTGAGLAAVGLAKDEYVAWSAELDEQGITSKGSVLLSDERFRLAATTTLPNEQVARLVEERVAAKEQTLAMLSGGGLSAQEAQVLTRIVQGFDLKRQGKRVDLVFELVEPPIEQARDLGVMAALAVHGVRKYLSNAKQAEAKNTLSLLARMVVVQWEAEDGKPAAKKKLASYPPVPRAVPKGEKAQTSAADWRAWAPLRFEMTSPQYYQYEIKAAKDGESAEIIARGDLNGDGKTSQFSLVVRVRRPDGYLWISPEIDAKDPEE